MFSKKIIGIALIISGCAIIGAFLWVRKGYEPVSQPPAVPAREETEEMSAFVAVTPYGYDRDDMNVGEWQIAAYMKDAVEGKEGCQALRQREGSYIPVSFEDGARCEVVKKNGVTIAYGVGYGWAYEWFEGLGAAVYVFHTDGFVIQHPSDLPDLQTPTPEWEAALRAFDRTRETVTASDWNAFGELNHAQLRKELEAPSPRVAEAMEALRAHVESLKL